MMTILAWLVLGLVAGFVASKIMKHTGSSVLVDTGLGIVGAFIGGIIFRVLGGPGVTGFNLWSLVVAVLGSIAVLAVYRAVSEHRTATRTPA